MGDPFKDTSGPSMNILIKLMSIVSLVIAPTLADIQGTNHASAATVMHNNIDSKNVEMKANAQKLIDALATDGLLNKEQYHLVVDKGNITINEVAQPLSVNRKYENLTDKFGNSVIDLFAEK